MEFNGGNTALRYCRNPKAYSNTKKNKLICSVGEENRFKI
jgi:hypothetical protein